MNAPEVLEHVASVRDIRRACDCPWRMAIRRKKPAGWVRTGTAAECHVHAPGLSRDEGAPR
jgi:hypothetical protein